MHPHPGGLLRGWRGAPCSRDGEGAPWWRCQHVPCPFPASMEMNESSRWTEEEMETAKKGEWRRLASSPEGLGWRGWGGCRLPAVSRGGAAPGTFSDGTLPLGTSGLPSRTWVWVVMASGSAGHPRCCRGRAQTRAAHRARGWWAAPCGSRTPGLLGVGAQSPTGGQGSGATGSSCAPRAGRGWLRSAGGPTPHHPSEATSRLIRAGSFASRVGDPSPWVPQSA